MSEPNRAGGIPSWAARLGSLYRDVALIGVGTLLALLFFDIVAGAALWGLNLDTPTAASLDYYQAQEWGETYWREYRALERAGARRYEPFSIWRFREYSSETVNVDADGLRRIPGADCDDDFLTVLVFGGSTTWGTASPDWGTIPAYLVTEWRARRRSPVCVVSFAQGGHVSTQELIELVRALEAGVRPDLVIFYDGINDTVAAAESGRAGVHQALRQIRDRFEHNESPLGRLVKESNLGELVDRLRRRLYGKPRYPDDFDVERLGSAVVEHYLAHAEVVRALGRSYGFEAALFWQPVLSVGDVTRSPRERRMRETMDPSLRRLYDKTWSAMQEAAPHHPGVFYIADVLDRTEDEVYTDRHHVTPLANRVIAGRIAELAIGPMPATSK